MTAPPVERPVVSAGTQHWTAIIRSADARALAVRVTAPGTRTPVLGTLSVKSDVQIDGRTTDAKWMRVVFPPNNSSDLHGWIDAANLDIIGDPASLVVATAEPPVVVLLPTEPPAVLTAIALARTPRPSGTRTATPALKGVLPDLVIGSSSTVSGGKLFVTVINQGKGDMHGDLVVAVFNRDGTKLLGGATLPKFTLAAARSIDLATGYVVAEDQSLLLVVDPNGDIAETDHTNNRIIVSIALGNVSPPPLPGQTTPTPYAPRTLVAMVTATATPTPNIPATLIALATEAARTAR